jgi:hypothetical protein
MTISPVQRVCDDKYVPVPNQFYESSFIFFQPEVEKIKGED